MINIKLAHDVYLTLYDTTGMAIFSNIAQAEQTHTDSVKLLLNKYGLTEPVNEPAFIGTFTNPTLQSFYYQLVNEGAVLTSALQVGAKIEELDINDIEYAITQTDNADIRLVYQNLLKGSRNHSRAFYRTIQNQGADYQPEYISQESFDRIVATRFER